MRNNPIHIPTVKKIFENFYPNACGFKKKLYLCNAFEKQSKRISTFAPSKSPDGGIGRRAGLKHQWIHFHAGSIPALGTEVEKLD